MGSRRWKVISFNVAIIAVTTAVHQRTLSRHLDEVVGFSWSTGLVDFLRINSQGLMVLVLLSLLFEFTRYDELKEYLTSRDSQVEHQLTTMLLRQEPRSLVSYSIASFHAAPEAEVSSLTNMVAPKEAVFRDASMNVHLRRSDSSDFYWYDSEFRFTTDQREILFAVTNRTTLVDSLLTRVPLLVEAWSHHDGRDLSQVSSTSDYVSIIESVRHSDGTVSDRLLKMTRVPAAQSLSYYSDGEPLPDSDVALFSYQFPREDWAREHSISLRMVSKCPTSDTYTYWIASRTMYLKQLSFDARDLLHADSRLQFCLHPCLGLHRTTDANEEASGRMRLYVNSWIVRGQGAFVTWKLRDRSEDSIRTLAGQASELIARTRGEWPMSDRR